MSHGWVGRRLLLAGCLLLGTVGAYGQTLGSIAGEVRDASGAIIPEAKVTATNTGTNAQRSALTNAAGEYAFPSLPPGMYQLKAERSGFKTLLRSQVEIQVQQNARMDFELQVGQISESVEVAASPVLVTENATVGTVIENRRIVELPLNGRNYLQLVSLSPNVSTGFSTQGQAAARQGGIRSTQTISVAGQRTNFNHYTLDGVENTDPNFNTYVVMPSMDALQEFKVQTGIYPAEFGRQATQINVLDQIGHEPVSRYGVRVFAQRQAGRDELRFHPLRPRRIRSSGISMGSRWRSGLDPEDVPREGQAVLHGEL